MRFTTKMFLVSAVLGLVAVGCDKQDSGTKATPSATAPATTSAAAPATTSAAASTAPAASSAAPATSDSAAPGNVHLTVESAKAASGKVDGGQRKVKANAMKMRRKCIDPELKKDAGSVDGSVVITLELNTEGKTTKASHKTDGKFPEDAAKCMEKVLSELEFDTENTKAKFEVKIAAGPNVKPDK